MISFSMRMSSVLFAVALLSLVACTNSGETVATGQQSAGTAAADSGATDAGGSGADAGGVSKPKGDECKIDKDCGDKICHFGLCTTTCKATADCGDGQGCSLGGSARMVCTKPSYNKGIGVLCGADGKCAAGLKCAGRPYSAQAFCTTSCGSDVDCPSSYRCADVPKSGKICIERGFCGVCQFDAQCGAGGACVKMKTGSFCATPCTNSGTDCPRFATCQDVGGGRGMKCVHTAGTCVGEGKQCDPCNPIFGGSQCGKGACLQFSRTKEAFCGLPCTTTCAAGYSCAKVSAAGARACVPAEKSLPKCVNKLHNMFEVGATMDDFAMVGMVDLNGDGILHDEQPRVIHISDFEGFHNLLLINITAVWCSACQAETIDMRKWLNSLYDDIEIGLFQVVFDGQKPGELITMPLLKAWQKQLKPAGTCGMDPNRLTVPWNTAGSTPINMLIDTKTRKVLWKQNGYSKSKMIYQINKNLKLLGYK